MTRRRAGPRLSRGPSYSRRTRSLRAGALGSGHSREAPGRAAVRRARRSGARDGLFARPGERRVTPLPAQRERLDAFGARR